MRSRKCTFLHKFGQLVWAIIALSAFMIPAVTLAQSAGVGTTYEEITGAANNEDDHSRGILKNLLSDFAENPFAAVGEPDTLLGNLFFLFNSGIFIVGTALLSYFILASVAQTAHEGEVLGKRINGLWVPIRVSLGVFGMLPVFGGFSLAQAIVMWFVILGIGLANLMSSAAISNTELMNALIPPPGIAEGGNTTYVTSDFARQLFLMNVCVDTANRYYQETKDDDWFSWLRSEPRLEFSPIGGQTSIRSVGVEGCGSVLLKKEDARDNAIFGWRSPAVNYADIQSVSNITYQYKSAELLRLNTEMAREAQAFVNAYYKNDGSEQHVLPGSFFDQQVKESNQAISDETKAAIQDTASGQDAKRSALTESASNEIKKGGWMSLGSWHSTYAEVQAALQTAAYNGQFIINPVSDFSDADDDVNETLRRMMSTAGYVVSKPSEEPDYPFGQDLLVGAFNMVAGDTAGTNMVNPITTAKSAGDFMINLGLAMYAVDVLLDSIGGGVAKKALELGSNIVSFGGPLGQVAKVIAEVAKDFASILPVLGGLLIIVGGVLAIYVPMIPFLTWIAAVVSYFVSVIEGLVAAQVWAFGHLSMDGEGMGQKTEKGYQYLLSALLRPPLMVLGFFFASAILILIGTFVVNEMATVISNVQGNSMTGIISMLGFFVLFAILLITLVSTVFDMIFYIPDRVIAWFGNGLEASMAKNMDAKIEGQTKAATAWAGGAGAVIQKVRSSRPGKQS